MRKFVIDIDMGGFRITNAGSPTASTDLATKAYVDALIAGVEVKQTVRAATTGAGTLATSFANGSVIDGVTLATNDRLLVKNQATASENGVYVVNATGAPTRATDFDGAGDNPINALIPVSEGTTNHDTAWWLTVDAPVSIGTTNLTFVQFGAGAVYTAGTGIAISGTTVSVDHAVVAEKFETDIGDGSSTSITVTHNLGTKANQVTVYDNTTPFAEQYPEVRHTGVNTITLVFGNAPTLNQFHCVVQG